MHDSPKHAYIHATSVKRLVGMHSTRLWHNVSNRYAVSSDTAFTLCEAALQWQILSYLKQGRHNLVDIRLLNSPQLV